jgi:hypothetical protein
MFFQNLKTINFVQQKLCLVDEATLHANNADFGRTES